VGVVSGDTVSLNSSSYAATFASKNVGSGIAVTVTGLSLSGASAGNYTLTQPTGLTGNITAVTLTAAIIGNPMKPYDGNAGATLTAANYSLTGLVSGESITVMQTVGAYNSKDVATAITVTASLTGANFTPGTGTLLSNYLLPTTASGPGQISPRPATWTTNLNSKTYGDPDPGPLTTGSGTNFIASDGITASYSRVAGETVAGGPYHISATLSAASGVLNNYNVTNVGAEFSINKRNATWTTNAASKTYGDPDASPLTTGASAVAPNNFLAADNVTASYSRAAGETVEGGPYHITATLSAAAGVLNNYNVANVGADFTINRRNATWTTNAASKTYGDPDASPLTTGSGTNFLAADGIAAAYSRAAGETVGGGPYHISATLSSTVANALDNYNLTNVGADFTINPRPISVAPDPGQTKVYGDPDPMLTFSVGGSGLASGDTKITAFTGSLSRAAGENVGTYVITQGTLVPTSNYTITGFTTGVNFSITVRYVTVTADPHSKIFGQPDPALSYRVTSGSLAFIDTFTGALTRAPGETVAGSPYAILQGSLALNPNYVLTYIGANLTITQATTSLVVTSGANPSTFNAALTFTATVADSSPSSTGNPTGTVKFYATYYGTNTPVLLGSGTLSLVGGKDVATFTTAGLPVNANTITATYGGDGNFTGNTGTMTQTVTYATSGTCGGDAGHQVLQPVNSDGTSVFKYGSTVPVKFRVCDANGVSIGSAGLVKSFTVAGYVSGTVNNINETVTSTTSDTAFRWDPTGQQWIFNLATSGLSKGATAVFTIQLNDGSIVGPALGGANLDPGISSFQFGLK
jgi:hypothetical protein